MDMSDYRLVQSIREVNEDMLKELKALRAQQDRSLQNDLRMAEAFNRVAQALEGLTREVRGLRDDLTPPLDKPKKKLGAAKPEGRA
ncbi:MAG: hypothetical protein GC185_03060 [Alphaproteobacteria bacterium]|nr:hypothetical protein [Alphaproteobacteria bacterium]